jgi:hypothetical protein
MKKLIIVAAMWLALLGVNGTNLLAGEHGGQEHGGSAMEGSHTEGSPEMAEDHAATLREAAKALKETHPDLAKKLEQMAEKMQ